MNEHLRDRILRKLETLSDERGYQVLDYVGVPRVAVR